MSPSDKPTPLYLHTLDSLCNELVSGRALLLDDESNEFRLSSAETRSIFDWYRRNQGKWAGRVLKGDVEALADQLDKEPPELPPVGKRSENQQQRIVHLHSVRAHRFAGIHWYGSPEKPPDDFYFEFDKPLTLIEGMNGSGKTSLLSAITWCLTGHVYRSQRLPETTDQSVSVEIVEEAGNGSNDEPTHDMTAITPMPSAEILRSLGDGPLPLDTWVELTFVDEAGNETGKIRRSVQRSPRGKIVVTEPDFSTLGLDAISREVGTKMPGLIPYIQIGITSDLGKAVAELTGIKPLEDVAKHAEKSKIKLQKDLVKDREAEITNIDSRFLEAHTELTNLITDHPDIDPKRPLPTPGPAKTIEKELSALKQHLEDLQAQALAEAKLILGESFDPDDATARKNLMDNVGPALGLLDTQRLKQLPSANRLSNLANLKDGELSQAEVLIEKLIAEANELATLSERPDVHVRLRLYARIAGWIKDLPQWPHAIEDCPVCQSALKGKTDGLTGKAISEHIQQYLDTDSDYLEKTLSAWEDNAVAILAKNLPDPLQLEIKKDLPEKPTVLISDAIGEELFKSPIFGASLSPLKSAVQSLCTAELYALPPFEEPPAITLPECFGKNGGSLTQAIGRVTRAVAFTRWRQRNGEVCKEAFVRIVGHVKPGQEGTEPRETTVENWSMRQRLDALDRMVKSTAPLTEGLSSITTMTDKLAARRKKEDRIALYQKASVAIDGLLGLSDLVERQVSFLMQKLLSATLQWKDNFYMPAFSGAPKVVGTDVGTDGSLAISAEADGARASAHHISNASDLRATLLAFLIAFWKHLLESRGGLSLLLLDDLQELFDRENRRRVANSVPSMVECGGRVIVTTNDPTFGKRVKAACVAALSSNQVDRRRVHPLIPVRPHIELGQFVESIEEKRRAFEDPKNQNEPQPARDYVKDLRIYLENQLLDFFDIHQPGLPKKPTLSDLIGAIRTRTRVPHDSFASQVFAVLASDQALANNSSFLDLMNQSHHGNEDQITFNEVWQSKDECFRIRKLVDAAHEDYERWLRRDSREPAATTPDLPKPIAPPHFDVPVITDLAAFTTDTPPSETMEAHERFSSSWFENRAVYVINTDNLGFAGTRNCRVVVDLTDEAVTDNTLVIALHQDKVYARRLLHDPTNPGIIGLGSEAENPLDRLRSLFLPINEVRLLKIVGILFDDRPYFPRPSGEAALVNDSHLLEKVDLIFQVRGDSALPLALPGQMILAGSSLTPSQLGEMEGRLVAIATSEGMAFKRTSKAVPGVPHVRQFESIGGLGESMLVRTQDIEDTFGSLPLLLSMRLVLGVLYEST